MADQKPSLDYATTQLPKRPTPFRPWLAAGFAFVPIFLMFLEFSGAISLGAAGNTVFFLIPVLAVPGIVLGFLCRPRDSFEAVLAQFAIVVSLLTLVGTVLFFFYAATHLPG